MALRLIVISHTGLCSGAERVLVRYVEAAVEEGWTVTCASPLGPLVPALTAVGGDHVELPDLKLAPGSRAIGGALLARRWVEAARVIRRLDGDLILVNGVLGLAPVRLACPDIPVVWLVHDVIVRSDLQTLCRASISTVDLAIGVSESSVALARRLGATATVVRNGTDWPVDPAPPPTARARPIIGLNAVLTPWKGHRVALEAAKSFPPGVTLEFLGGHFPSDEHYVAELEHLAKSPELAGRVRFLGHVDHPLERMRCWDLSLSASVEPEAACLAVIESMSIGVPVIGTAHGGVAELLGDAGVLVPPGDAASLAAAVTRLLGDAPARRNHGAAGRRQVAESMRYDQSREAMLSTLADVARRGVRKGCSPD